MRHAIGLTLSALSTLLVIACSGGADPEPLPTADGDAELALTSGDDSEADVSADSDAVDKDRRGEGRRHRRGRHRPPPAEPTGQSCEVAGQIFPDGSAVPSGDSCNTCGCNDGSVSCTLALCEPGFCPAILENPDGVCSRFPLDPCISQDPDCVQDGGSCEAGGQIFPDGSGVSSGDSCNTCGCNDGSVICTLVACEPVVCALFVEESDGVCSRFPLDPCISQDPDCLPDAGSCVAAGQTFPDGSEVPSGDSCNGCACNDGSIICTLVACEPVACAQFIEAPDGVCSRFPLDPCQFQDPDCSQPLAPTAP